MEKKNLTSEKETVSYSLGLNIAFSLKDQGFEDLNIDTLGEAIKDVFNNNQLAINPDQAGEILNDYFQNMQARKFEKNIIEGETFLKENSKKEGVTTLKSGLQYQVLKEGNGPKPKATDKVTTHYHGTLIDGTVFDSSVQRGQPATFPVNGVIPGWVEALQLMNTGSKWRLFVPSNLAYGNRAVSEKIGPNSTLIFDVELISIN
jgi:FKBP-type peptidyl-prolyl cis-trans isomerase FklB